MRSCKLIRLLCDYAVEPVVLVTETNVPKAENLSYFGKPRRGACRSTTFPLPPLILHAMHVGVGASSVAMATQDAARAAGLRLSEFHRQP